MIDKHSRPRLSYRVARPEDYPLLVQLRVECNWGVPDLERGWTNPNRVYCVFELASEEGESEDVGMGCWVLEEDEPDVASRQTKSVHIAALFIRHKYQGQGFGSKAIQILESVAVDKYDAQWVTLDTTAYHCEFSPDGLTGTEDFSRPGKNVAWYNKNGYVKFKENRPAYLHPLFGRPDYLLTAIYLRKPASAVKSRN
ncbi:hypothetical protein CI109_104411 [Kwoniella shandongensis]|uniref:Uncharacterized protein n=1 Tax=Kwoniella shandongensis TaxID=1734106 RepID=A0A5M6BWV6_9TREE|nr:uncharacterized protein CI109_004190 [Kwoniella shandongensis]KAA5527377.1 hypothetical protein CI109_004190 [Kwoniella shandongensis]